MAVRHTLLAGASLLALAMGTVGCNQDIVCEDSPSGTGPLVCHVTVKESCKGTAHSLQDGDRHVLTLPDGHKTCGELGYRFPTQIGYEKPVK